MSGRNLTYILSEMTRPSVLVRQQPDLRFWDRLSSPSGYGGGWGVLSRHAGGQHEVTRDVEHGTAHVEDAVDAQDDADSLARHADAAQHHNDQGDRPAGHAGRAHAGEHRHQHYGELLAERQVHA